MHAKQNTSSVPLFSAMRFVLYIRGQLDCRPSPTAANEQRKYLREFADTERATVEGTFSDPIPEVDGYLGPVPELHKAIELCRETDATLVYLTMGAWRRNPLFFQAIRDFEAEGGNVLRQTSKTFHDKLEVVREAFCVHVQRTKSGRKGGLGKRRQSTIYIKQNIIDQLVGLREQGLTFARIAETLNAEGKTTFSGKPWSPDTVRKVLKNSATKKKR
ncbi:MAG: hypothetical protein VR70_05280 [Rhodospirillaceae bacterium BRH_c57]|nr:MAG: hypothetical protein VR70_05280 [Rhodospirillaceae bacterium BRH_c57]